MSAAHAWTLFVIFVSIVFGAAQAVVSRENQTHGGRWLFAAWLLGTLAPWAFVSRFSRDLFFDSLIYDLGWTLAFYVALCCRGNERLTFGQYVGLAICVAGILTFKGCTAQQPAVNFPTASIPLLIPPSAPPPFSATRDPDAA